MAAFEIKSRHGGLRDKIKLRDLPEILGAMREWLDQRQANITLIGFPQRIGTSKRSDSAPSLSIGGAIPPCQVGSRCGARRVPGHAVRLPLARGERLLAGSAWGVLPHGPERTPAAPFGPTSDPTTRSPQGGARGGWSNATA